MVDTISIPSVFLQEREVNSLFQIHGLPVADCRHILSEFGIEQPPESGKSCSGDDVVMMCNGPGMWLFESIERSSEETLDTLRELLQPTNATVTDLSSARTIVRVSGKSRRHLLKKGCPVDIDSMNDCDVVSTLIGHLGATIHCRNEYFDLYILQSYGTDFWEWCRHNAREFNI